MTIPPQGYAWWYIDAISDDGTHGFSIIAMIGSVFSPYYAWSGRHDPLNHHAFNVGLYGGGKKRWTMTERGRNALHRDAHSLQMGPSSLSWDGDTLIITIDEWANPLPRRVRGTIRVTPSAITQKSHVIDGHGRHIWQPIAPVGRAEVRLDSPDLNWNGEAYLDSNWGTEPLETGFKNWDWSRAALKDGAGIFYDSTTRDGKNHRLALRYESDGSFREVPAPPRQTLSKGPIWRVPRYTLAETPDTVTTERMLEDTPFYTRSHIQTVFDGEPARAVHESLDCDRYASTWVRCLLPFKMPRRSG
ncbi:carotenoid 1,2-hydratase [Pseudahrensia aquimaris]|uniref:Carotenoid 1,2-hydratase n=1 Tax=Pseudahrensia aquimaris TaxID=744461 RepID=A0ABW3FI65_9HYPH